MPRPQGAGTHHFKGCTSRSGRTAAAVNFCIHLSQKNNSHPHGLNTAPTVAEPPRLRGFAASRETCLRQPRGHTSLPCGQISSAGRGDTPVRRADRTRAGKPELHAEPRGCRAQGTHHFKACTGPGDTGPGDTPLLPWAGRGDTPLCHADQSRPQGAGTHQLGTGTHRFAGQTDLGLESPSYMPRPQGAGTHHFKACTSRSARTAAAVNFCIHLSQKNNSHLPGLNTAPTVAEPPRLRGFAASRETCLRQPRGHTTLPCGQISSAGRGDTPVRRADRTRAGKPELRAGCRAPGTHHLRQRPTARQPSSSSSEFAINPVVSACSDSGFRASNATRCPGSHNGSTCFR